jgi:hypothetical protein
MAKLRKIAITLSENIRYISPDDVYIQAMDVNMGRSPREAVYPIAFFYFPDGKLLTDIDGTHYDIVDRQLDFFEKALSGVVSAKTLRQKRSQYDHMDYIAFLRDQSEKISLVGRFHKDPKKGTIVSFWNTIPETYDYLSKCLEDLDKKYKFGDNYIISTPIHGTKASRYLNDKSETERPKSDAVDTTLAKELHTMRVGKKEAMSTLGVGGGGKKKQMQTAYEKEGLIKPGQKYWAPTSESKK